MALDGLLYALGGMNKMNQPVVTVDVYHPSTARWNKNLRLKVPGKIAGAAVLHLTEDQVERLMVYQDDDDDDDK